MIPTGINFDELMTEVEKLRMNSTRQGKEFSDEQIKFMRACREIEPPVTYKDMAILWEKAGWGKKSQRTICDYVSNALKKD
jgi:hypothetical protein